MEVGGVSDMCLAHLWHFYPVQDCHVFVWDNVELLAAKIIGSHANLCPTEVDVFGSGYDVSAVPRPSPGLGLGTRMALSSKIIPVQLATQKL